MSQLHDHVALFTDQVQLPPQAVTTLREAHTHSDHFRCALDVLVSTLAFVRAQLGTGSVACAQVLEQLETLRADVVGRVMVRLEGSLRLLSDPSSTFEILRDALLYKRKYLLEFVAEMGDDEDMDEVLRQYVYIATRVTEERIGSYCEALATWARIERAPESLFGFASIARGTTGIFSAIFTDILPASGVPADVREEAKVNAVGEAGEKGQGALRRERVQAVLRRWMDALKAASEPCLTLADIMMRQRDSFPTVEEVCRNAVVLYLDSVEREKTFLRGAFGEGSVVFLEDMFRECEEPLLSMIEAEVGDALMRHDDLRGILICLLLNRLHRSRIKAMETLDARISFLVQVEKLLQTRLLAEFDSSLEKLAKLPVASSVSGLVEIHHASSMVTLTGLVVDILVVIIQAAKDVQAGDIFDTIQRRLLSFTKHVVETIEVSGHNITDQVSRLKSSLESTAVVLTTLEIPTDLVRDNGTASRVKEPLIALLSRTCDEYGACVVQKNVVELFKAENAIQSRRFDEAKAALTQFQNQLSGKIESIMDSYSFLQDKDNISEQIRRTAVEAAVRILAEKVEHVARLVQKHMPTESHLVVTRGELVHATREHR